MVQMFLKMFFALVVVFSAFVRAGEGGRLLLEAQKLTAAGAFGEAITEYERYLFFTRDSPAVPVYLAIAGLYKKQERFSDAQKALRSALAGAATDSMRYEIRIQYAVLEIARGRYASAEMELIRIASFSAAERQRLRARFFLFMAHVLTGEWNEASDVIADPSFSADERLLRCLRILKTGDIRRRKSPNAARWMSTFVPGLGQMYAHDLSGGINALAVSFLTVFLTANSVIEGYYQEAVLTDAMLFWRYYSGNRWNAADAAEKYNARTDGMIRNRLLEVLSSPGLEQE
jgi:tetratricopeptide (TPR) repeat protein